MQYPLNGNYEITGRFEPRESMYIDGVWTLPFHYGVDWGAPAGTPVHAVADGAVTFAGWDYSGYGGGWHVIIDHGDGLTSHYLHMRDRPTLNVGQRVRAGQQIGVVGDTGISRGSHLHLEIKRDGVAVDPLPLLRHTEYSLGEIDMPFAAVIDNKHWYLVIPQGSGKPKAVILYGESQVEERGEFPVVYFSHENAKKAFWRAVDRA